MESLRKQAAKLLGEQRKYKRWLGVFLCLAVLVTAGTVAALTMSGQALSHKQQVLECKLEVHEHTAECYESGIVPQKGTEAASEAEKPICGYADYVVHVHNDDCRDKDGELVCVLPEVKAHEHTEACYEDQPVLLCELEETPGHVHGEECKRLICGLEGTEAGEGQDNAQAAGHVHSEECRTLICGVEEVQGHTHSQECRTLVQGEMICESTEEGHEHNDQCFAWNEELICGLEETEGHTHTEDCYDLEGCGLTEGGEANEQTAEGHVHTESCYAPDACGLEEGAEGHTHGEECYEIQKVVICGQLELHTHVTKEEAAEGAESCYDTEGNLICGIPELKEHVHGEDCFVTVELTKEEVEAAKEAEEAAKSESADSAKTEHTLYQKVYEDELVKVIAEYDETANIPAEAELYVEIVSEADDVQEENAPTQDAQTGTETEKESDSENNAEGTTSSGEDTAGAGEAEDTEEVQSEGAADTGESADTEDAQPEENTADETDEPINTTSEQVEAPAEGADDEEQGNSEADNAAGDETIAGGTEAGTEDGESAGDGSADIAGTETGENAVKPRGRIEIVPQEVIYKIGFRLDGAEIQPAGEVRVTVWNLEEEESEPRVIVYSAEDHSGQMTFSLTRMVEVFVQTEFQKVYEDNSIRIIAEYEKSADIPEEAELRVYEITPESDPERFADCETKFKEAVEDEEAEMTTLLDIGFYLDDTEIEPKDTVTMMVQFLDGEGQPIGESINVVHFAEDKTEVLEESENAEEGFIVFTTESFSPFAFFRAVGATVGVGLSNVGTNEIPLYVLQDGNWEPLEWEAGENDPISGAPISFTGVGKTTSEIKYENGYCKLNLAGPTAVDGSRHYTLRAMQSYDENYKPEDWLAEYKKAKQGYKRIGISYRSGESEYITTAHLEQVDWNVEFMGSLWVAQGLCTWVSDSEIPENSITGIYYLKGNDEDMKGVPLASFKESYGQKSFPIVFNPGNGTADKLRTSYGSIEPVTINIPSEAITDGSVTIRLPGDGMLGQEFCFYTGEGESTQISAVIGRENGGYDYELVGWYDIVSKTYYSVENTDNGYREVTLPATGEKYVFYADWVAASYNVPADKKAAIEDSLAKEEDGKAEDISDFVTTRVFDYNELFNVYSTGLINDNSDWETQVNFSEDQNMNNGSLKSALGHTLNLQSTEEKNFPFIQTVNANRNENEKNAITWPLTWARYPSNSAGNTENQRGIVGGIGADRENSTLLKYLFPEESNADKILGVHFVGYGNYLFKHYESSDDRIGYYEYDSEKNAALYDQESGRFYIDSAVRNIKRENGTTTSYHPSFLPFNYGSDTVDEDSTAVNYHFGICSEINFYLPADSGTEGANMIDGNHMTFEFSGDDDVWVFVDDKLVLDLGGLHYRAEAVIDFTDGEVRYKYNYTNKDSTTKTESLAQLKGGKSHKLTIYYLERGAGLSNCKIKFNIAPEYAISTPIADTLEVTKQWQCPEGVTIPEYIELSLYRKADWGEWNRAIQGKKRGELQSKLNLSNEDFEQFIKDMEQQLTTCAEFTLLDTVKIKTDGGNSVSYTWEGLSPYFQYEVRETEIPGFTKTVTKAPSTSKYTYWAESKTLSGTKEIIILNADRTKALACKDGSISEVEVKVENGVIITPDTFESGDIVKEKVMQEQIIWIVEESKSVDDETEEYYSLKSKAEGKYLSLENGLSVSNSAYSFKLENMKGNGLCDSQNRVIYDGGFKSAGSNQNDLTNGATDKLRVSIYTKQEVTSQVYHYTVKNTYVPNIMIRKVDCETDRIINQQEGKNAFFTLTRILTNEDQSKEYSYYDGTAWIIDDASVEEHIAQNAEDSNQKGVFELKNGNLVFKELPDGEYTLTEIKAPEGYRLPEAPENRKICFRMQDAKIVISDSENLPVIGENKPIAAVSGGLTLLIRNELPPVYTAKVQFTKYSTNTNIYSKQPLGGAEFRLYRQLTEEEVENGSLQQESLPGIDSPVTDITEKNISNPSNKDTGIFFSGELSGGTYYLKETNPPDGYSVLTDIVKIDISVDSKTQSVTVNLNDDKVKVVRPSSSDANSYWEIQVFNTQGFELPETGSLGTKPFTIGGAMLITAAAILMYGYSVRRRKSERRSK